MSISTAKLQDRTGQVCVCVCVCYVCKGIIIVRVCLFTTALQHCTHCTSENSYNDITKHSAKKHIAQVKTMISYINKHSAIKQ